MTCQPSQLHTSAADSVTKNCPLCGSRTPRRIKTLDVQWAVKLWRDVYNIDITPEFRGVSQMELWRCGDCLVSFFLPDFLAGSQQMYSQLEEIEGYYPRTKWEFDVALKDLCGRERILEIGCGCGNFIALAQKQGLSVEGLEQNPRAIEEAVRRGFRVREGTAEDAARQSSNSYDALCSFQVLEHIARPGEFLRACCSILRPGGLLIFAVPNQRSYVRHALFPTDMPPHHMTRWTRASFVRVARFFPLRLTRTAYEPLTENQIEMYVDTYDSLFRRRGFVPHPWVRTRTIRAIRRLRLGRFIRGQNMYACYVRL
jgi:2-polyprenyl-3-methyl-5-hydroxy-6-metoxy-1,4-benzoquinol methylase